MSFNPNFDYQQFQFMISQLESIRTNTSSFEESTNTVCDQLNNKYIIPLVGKPDESVDVSKMEHIKFSTSKE